MKTTKLVTSSNPIVANAMAALRAKNALNAASEEKALETAAKKLFDNAIELAARRTQSTRQDLLVQASFDGIIMSKPILNQLEMIGKKHPELKHYYDDLKKAYSEYSNKFKKAASAL